MERQKNHLRFVKNEKELLPIEEEFLFSIKSSIENKIGANISNWKKYESHILYDCYLIIANNKPYFLKVNLSPDCPNSWDDLSINNYNFHPSIILSSSEHDEFKFICIEVPKGRFLSDLSNYPLSPKLRLQSLFAKTLNEMHSIKLKQDDDTVKIFDSLLPREAMMVAKRYPVIELFSTARSLFKKIYKSDINQCGLCHFDLTPQNIIYTETGIKFINFEYSANANIYLDILLAKETLNCSDQVFEEFLKYLPSNTLENLNSHKEAADLFCFAYFNSKIISEYITFGLRNPPVLKYWINKSEFFYNKNFDKLFVQKPLDKLIRDFYYLWH